MILHKGERVYWGAPEIIYLEGIIQELSEETQSVQVRIERTTPHSAHLIGSKVSFAANGLMPLHGESPTGTTSERRTERQPPPRLSDDEKVRRTAAVAVHQQYGYTLPIEREDQLINQVAEVLNSDDKIRSRIITSVDEILKREF